MNAFMGLGAGMLKGALEHRRVRFGETDRARGIMLLEQMTNANLVDIGIAIA